MEEQRFRALQSTRGEQETAIKLIEALVARHDVEQAPDRRGWSMPKDAAALRLCKKALANQVAIVVGSSSSDPRYSIPALAEEIKAEFKADVGVEHPSEWFMKWNELLEAPAPRPHRRPRAHRRAALQARRLGLTLSLG